MNFEAWEKEVPEEIRMDSLWRMTAYRLASFLADIGWHDVTKLMKNQRTRKLSDQLYRSLGSISSNLAEGYSRSSGKARAIYYEYALGSARESRDWFYKGRHILGQAVATHCIRLLTDVIRLLLTMVPDQRDRTIREENIKYQAFFDETDPYILVDEDKLHALLKNVPLPDL